MDNDAPPEPDARARLTHDQAQELVLRIVSTQAESLLRTAYRNSLCDDDAHDAYQRSMEIFLRRAQTLDPRSAHKWIHVVVKREAQQLRRARSGSVAYEAIDFDLHVASEVSTPEERVLAKDRAGRAAEALRRLKPQERRAMGLKAFGHSYEEISQATGYSGTKVNRCLTEGRKSFLERFEGIEEGAECQRWQPVLVAMVSGEATAAQITEARPHLRNCSACKATLRGSAPATPAAEGGAAGRAGERRREAVGAPGAAAARHRGWRRGRRCGRWWGGAPGHRRREAGGAARGRRGGDSGRRAGGGAGGASRRRPAGVVGACGARRARHRRRAGAAPAPAGRGGSSAGARRRRSRRVGADGPSASSFADPPSGASSSPRAAAISPRRRRVRATPKAVRATAPRPVLVRLRQHARRVRAAALSHPPRTCTRERNPRCIPSLTSAASGALDSPSPHSACLAHDHRSRHAVARCRHLHPQELRDRRRHRRRLWRLAGERVLDVRQRQRQQLPVWRTALGDVPDGRHPHRRRRRLDLHGAAEHQHRALLERVRRLDQDL